MQNVRLLLLAFAHRCYLLETVAGEKTGKTTVPGKFAIALMWIILPFCQCLQGNVRRQFVCVFTQSSKLVA